MDRMRPSEGCDDSSTLSGSTHVKILHVGFIVCIFFLLFFSGAVFRTNTSAPSDTRKLVDMCPDEERDPVGKIPSSFVSDGQGLRVTNASLNFSFVIPKDGFRFEENTLQEYEEPIYLPTYVYTMLLTYGQTRMENRLASYEIRFVIHPSWCNTETDWVAFLETYGWSALSKDERILMFTRVEKQQSGRTYRRLFTHSGTSHYEFEESWDNAFSDVKASESAMIIVKSFELTQEEAGL